MVKFGQLGQRIPEPGVFRLRFPTTSLGQRTPQLSLEVRLTKPAFRTRHRTRTKNGINGSPWPTTSSPWANVDVKARPAETMSSIPDFDSLPPVKGQPQGNTWGFWGDEDELGSTKYVNFLPPSLHV